MTSETTKILQMPSPTTACYDQNTMNDSSKEVHSVVPSVPLNKWQLSKLWHGRLNRMNYFLGTLFLWVPVFVLVTIWGIAALADPSGTDFVARAINRFIGIFIVFAILYFYPLHYTLAMRRWHDIGYSGWMTLLLYIPYIGLIPGLFLLFYTGDSGQNKYGVPPTKEGVVANVFNY